MKMTINFLKYLRFPLRAAVGIFAITCAVAAPPFEYEYSAASGNLPQDSTPQWGVRGRGNKAEVKDGRLAVQTATGQRAFFVIGHTDDGTTQGQKEAWNGASDETTVEFRFKGESSDQQFEIFQVQLSDGKQFWRLRFFNNRLYPLEKKVDISEPDTYRATIKGGLLTLSSERLGEIFRDRGARDASENPKKAKQPSNCLWFGTFSPNAEAPDATGSWELEFIRWTNKAALPGLHSQ